jgi:hypothetical protein
MRSDKVNTDLCEVTVLRRFDCKQKCHLSGASARCFEVRSVTLLIRSTVGACGATRPGSAAHPFEQDRPQLLAASNVSLGKNPAIRRRAGNWATDALILMSESGQNHLSVSFTVGA